MTRAVIYCRVSTEDEIQLNALEKQVEEAKAAIFTNGWTLVDQYVDEGKSGTMTKRRDEYNRLFQDLETNRFDIIVIKSQDRLMRSTKDWYIFVDKLVQNHKKLFFYLENKFYSSDDALITGIKAILAEEYSRDLSKKINNAHYHRQQRKGTVLITSNTWGYDKVGKDVVINEKEAEIVKLMFQMCADGYGSRSIAKTLTNKGVFSRSGKPFNDSTIRRIIRNPLFKGTYVMNKKHYDFNTKQNVYNDEDQWIYKENGVPAIVDEELWGKANAEMDRKTRINHSEENMKQKRGIKIGDHPLSGKIICGVCGSTFWRTRYKKANGDHVVNWCCCEYVRNGRKTPDPHRTVKFLKVKTKDRGCDNIHLNNDDIESLLMEIASQFYQDKDDLLDMAVHILRDIFQGKDDELLFKLNASMNTVTAKREKLLDRYLDGIIAEDVYKSKDADLEEQAAKIQKEINAELTREYELQNIDARINNIKQELENIINKDLAFHFICQHLCSIDVYPDRLLITYDIFPQTEVKISKINYRRTTFSVSERS